MSKTGTNSLNGKTYIEIHGEKESIRIRKQQSIAKGCKTDGEIEKLINYLGYSLLDCYLDRKWRRVVIKDSVGYKYNVALNALEKKSRPNIVYASNPYTLENICLWLKLNNKTFGLTPDNIYINSYSFKLSFICFVCKEVFNATWNNVQRGNGCGICKGKQVSKTTSLLFLRPDLVEEWSSKNLFGSESVTQGSDKVVLWKCKKCGREWCASISNRSQGSGCPRCRKSRGEKRIVAFFVKENILFIPQHTFSDCKNIRRLPFDFYLPEYNTTLEYQGQQHYNICKNWFFGDQKELLYLQRNDAIKLKYCNENNIPIIIIPYWEFNRIEKILSRCLLGKEL